MDFSICHDTVPLQIKIESCSNNNCNSNKDIKKAKYINFILLLGQTRRHTFLTSLHKSHIKFPLLVDFLWRT